MYIPVLLIIYKRDDSIFSILKILKEVNITKLYIAQDGPKNKHEKKITTKLLKEILQFIDWPCKVYTLVNPVNYGLKKHIPNSLTWFFKYNKYGIYLEDDTVPNVEFFKYMSIMLPRYKNIKKVFGISGCNLFSEQIKNERSYYLSKIPNIWGAGLYRRSWKLYDNNLDNFDQLIKTQEIVNYFFSKKYYYWANMYMRAIVDKKLNTWDFQILYAMAKNNMYFINSGSNMIINTGFTGKTGNTNSFLYNYRQRYTEQFPIIHSKKLSYFKENDVVYFNNLLKGGWVRLFANNLYLKLPAKIKLMVIKLLRLVSLSVI